MIICRMQLEHWIENMYYSNFLQEDSSKSNDLSFPVKIK